MSQETRHLIGTHLAALYDERMPSLPVNLVELLARLCVLEAMAEYDRARCSAQDRTQGFHPLDHIH